MVGHALRSAREAKRLTLNQAADETKIRVTYLQAIENGVSDILPSPVQSRGFVRSYAEYLGLDPKPVLDAWEHPEIPYPPISQTPTSEIPTTQPKLTRKFFFRSESKNKEVRDSAKTATDIYKEIGQELRERRESLGLTLDECAQQTLVRSEFLDDMENGDFDRLLSPVQARGMLHSYSTFLSMNVDQILLQFADALQTLNISQRIEKPEKKKTAKKKISQTSPIRRFFTPDLFIGVFMIVVMAVLIIYSLVNISEYRTSISEATVDQNLIFLEQLKQETYGVSYLPTDTPGPTIANVNNPTEVATVAPIENEEQVIYAINIQIAANQRSFLRVVVDGKETFVGRTKPNSEYNFHGQEMIEVSTGNAAAINITYNNENLGIIGAFGKNEVMQFSPLYVVTPTPLFSPTPTQTLEPTYTPVYNESTPTLTITPYIP